MALVLTAVVITLVIVRNAGLLHLPRRVAGILPDITRYAPFLRLLGRTGGNREKRQKNERKDRDKR